MPNSSSAVPQTMQRPQTAMPRAVRSPSASWHYLNDWGLGRISAMELACMVEDVEVMHAWNQRSHKEASMFQSIQVGLAKRFYCIGQ